MTSEFAISGQTSEIDRPEQRLSGIMIRRFAGCRRTGSLPCHSLIFDGRTHPHVVGPVRSPRRNALHGVGALREEQPIQPRRPLNKLPKPLARLIKICTFLEHMAIDAQNTRARRLAFVLLHSIRRAGANAVAEKSTRRILSPHACTIRLLSLRHNSSCMRATIFSQPHHGLKVWRVHSIFEFFPMSSLRREECHQRALQCAIASFIRRPSVGL